MLFFDRIETQNTVEFRPRYALFWFVRLLGLIAMIFSAGLISSLDSGVSNLGWIVFILGLSVLGALPLLATSFNEVGMYFSLRYRIETTFLGVTKLIISRADMNRSSKTNPLLITLLVHSAIAASVLFGLFYYYFMQR